MGVGCAFRTAGSDGRCPYRLLVSVINTDRVDVFSQGRCDGCSTVEELSLRHPLKRPLHPGYEVVQVRMSVVKRVGSYGYVCWFGGFVFKAAEGEED